MVLRVFRICNAAFQNIARSILHAKGEVSSEMTLVGAMLCFDAPKEKLQEGSRMHAATVPYCNFSMHTHPLVAYCSALCNMGHPSGDDMQAWYDEAHKVNGWPAIHLCFAIEGTYVVRVRILDESCVNITKKLSQQVFWRWATAHNTRSTKHTSGPMEQKKSQPRNWCNDANKVTYKHLFNMAGMKVSLSTEDMEKLKPIWDMTVFEIHFIRNKITFQGKQYLGEIFETDLLRKPARSQVGTPTRHLNPKCLGVDRSISVSSFGDAPVEKVAFYQAYTAELVKETCKRQETCSAKEVCVNNITKIEQCDDVFICDIKEDDQHKFRRQHEQQAYERMFDLIVAQHEVYDDVPPKIRDLRFEDAYKRIGGAHWLFHSPNWVKIRTANGDVEVIDRGSHENDKVATALSLVKAKIIETVQKLDTSSGLSESDILLMRHYYLSPKFTVNELPESALFIGPNGRMIHKATNLRGLNRPEGVNYKKILEMEKKKTCTWNGKTIDRQCHFECDYRKLYLRLESKSFGDKSMSALVAHEIAHVDDVVWSVQNHDDTFNGREQIMRGLIHL